MSHTTRSALLPCCRLPGDRSGRFGRALQGYEWVSMEKRAGLVQQGSARGMVWRQRRRSRPCDRAPSTQQPFARRALNSRSYVFNCSVRDNKLVAFGLKVDELTNSALICPPPCFACKSASTRLCYGVNRLRGWSILWSGIYIKCCDCQPLVFPSRISARFTTATKVTTERPVSSWKDLRRRGA